MASRPGRFRRLTVGGAILSGLVISGGAFTATTAHAATMDSSATCGEGYFYIPLGDILLMNEPGNGLKYIVAADAVTTDSGPVGYVTSGYDWPGQSWQDDVQSQLSTTIQISIDDNFGIQIGYNNQTSQYAPEVFYDSCTWTAQFEPDPTTSDDQYSSADSGSSSGTDMAGYYEGMAQDQGIMNSVDSDEGAGITADPGGDAGAGDGD
jgi:hypothetical protein